MLTITTAIQLLINAQLLTFARQQLGPSDAVSLACQQDCEAIGASLCNVFLRDLKGLAQNLSRNVVLLTGWTAIFLVQVSCSRREMSQARR